jgi:energy-coupling factor transport system permease protein
MYKESYSIHPVLSLICSLLLFITGLLFVKEIWFCNYLITFLILLLIFRFEKTILKVIPFVIIFGTVMPAMTLINGSLSEALYSFYRVLVLVMAGILSLSIKPIHLVRALNQLHIPRWINLGLLIVIRFMQIFREEMKQIRQAIILRGIHFFETPLLWGRAFLIPLTIRMLSISEGLAISLETRGFSTDSTGSSYEMVCFRKRDSVFLCLFLTFLSLYTFMFIRGI